jgi:MoaA/NifB/PqqE/SkfB family radical SAM enzyme
MRNDIAELCGFFTRKFPDGSIGILTNGMATDTIVEKSKEVLDRFSPRSLWLGSSLDGIGKTHDKIRGADGAFLRLCQTISRCKKELPGVDLSLTFTLTPYNVDQLVPAKQFADDEGVNFFAQFVVPKSSRQEFNWTPQELSLAEKEIGRIMEGISDKMGNNAICGVEGMQDKGLMAQLYFWSHLVKYQINPQRFFKKCVAGYRFAMLNPYGDLFFCPTHKDNSVGNLRENKFDYLWTCDKAEQLRRFISSGNCHCWLVCILFPVLDKVLSN